MTNTQPLSRWSTVNLRRKFYSQVIQPRDGGGEKRLHDFFRNELTRGGILNYFRNEVKEMSESDRKFHHMLRRAHRTDDWFIWSYYHKPHKIWAHILIYKDGGRWQFQATTEKTLNYYGFSGWKNKVFRFSEAEIYEIVGFNAEKGECEYGQSK